MECLNDNRFCGRIVDGTSMVDLELRESGIKGAGDGVWLSTGKCSTFRL